MIKILQVSHSLSYSIVFVKSMSTVYLDLGYKVALKEGYDRGWTVDANHAPHRPLGQRFGNLPFIIDSVPLTRLKRIVDYI